jgi:tetratricopeptide (TPR) repeat protein
MLRLSYVVALMGALVFSASASAQQLTARQALELARTHMEQGQELYGTGRFVEAAEEFLAAYDARPFSAFLYNAGIAYERHGNATRALELYEQYLERDPTASDAAEVQAKVAALRAQLAPPATNPDAPPVNPDSPPTPTVTTETTPAVPPEDMKSLLSVQTEPEGARIVVKQGGAVVAQGPSPFAQTLDEGEYELFVEHPDYRTVHQPVRIRAGKVYVVIIEMSQAEFLGYLRIAANVEGARVYIDDRNAGSQAAPYRAEIPTGEHTVWVERPGYAPQEHHVEVGLGEQVDVRAELVRVNYGRLRVIGNLRGANIYVDDREVGVIPAEVDVPAGTHQIRVGSHQMKDWEEQVEIQRGQVSPLRIRLAPAPPRSNAFAGMTLSVLTLGGGIGLGLMANNLEDELRLEQQAGTLASDDPRITRGKILSIGANVSFGLSALFAGLSIYFFVHDSGPPSEGTVLEPRDWSFAPLVDPTTGLAAVQVGRSF